MKKKNLSLPFAALFILLFNVLSCSKSDSPVTSTPPLVPTCSDTPGPLFTAVKTLITTRCSGCHKSTNANGGMDFSTNCNIVGAKTRIKVRAVDEGTMPKGGQLSQADKNMITVWVDAGGRVTD